MIATVTPYPKMRDSGVEWLGEVPEHWEMGRASSRLRIRNRPIHPREIPNRKVLHYSIPNVQQHGGGELESTASVASGKILVDREVLLVSKLNPRKGTMALARPHPALVTIASSEFVAMEPRACLGDFARYFFASEHVRLELSSRVDSATKSHQRCTPADIVKLQVPWPPMEEQTAIVRFLDDADRRIQRYIRSKERLIELLEEQKQVIIHQAVTGRIDVRTGQPYPAYKDSGVKWLGEVPEHWDVVGLGYRYEQCLGKMLDGKRITGECLVPYLRNVDVQWDKINVVDLPRMDIHPDEMPRYTVQPGDLLVCEGGEVGRCAIWKGEIDQCGFQKALHRLRPRDDERDKPRFLYFTLSVAATCSAFADGHESTIAHLTGEKLRRHRFAFPFADEQTAIARYLNVTTSNVNRTIELARRQISLAEEYRTRLIADVVTGKLDVREAVADLPVADPIVDGNRGNANHTETNSHATEHGIV